MPPKRPDTAEPSSPLGVYLRDINAEALLTAEEERSLAQSIAAGNVTAAKRMTEANLRLVVNIARGYTGKGMDLPDLVEEGNLGLLTAVEGFDGGRGTRFSTYASYWIKQSIRRALIWQSPTIRVPDYLVDLIRKWDKTVRRLLAERGSMPSDEEVGAAIGLTGKKLARRLKAMRAARRIVMEKGGGDFHPLDHVPGRHDDDPAVAAEQDIPGMLSQLGRLDERKAAILRLRFGLDDGDPHTLQEIADRMGLTRERVRQLEHEALGELRERIEGTPA